jgi:hypothetical protein
MHLAGYLFEDYHDARSVEHKSTVKVKDIQLGLQDFEAPKIFT